MLRTASVCILYWWVVFHYMDIPQFICSSDDRAFELFPVWVITDEAAVNIWFKPLCGLLRSCQRIFLKQLSVYFTLYHLLEYFVLFFLLLVVFSSFLTWLMIFHRMPGLLNLHLVCFCISKNIPPGLYSGLQLLLNRLISWGLALGFVYLKL